jgi:hypothetical protein
MFLSAEYKQTTPPPGITGGGAEVTYSEQANCMSLLHSAGISMSAATSAPSGSSETAPVGSSSALPEQPQTRESENSTANKVLMNRKSVTGAFSRLHGQKQIQRETQASASAVKQIGLCAVTEPECTDQNSPTSWPDAIRVRMA